MDNTELKEALSKIGTPQCRTFSNAIFNRHLPISLSLQHNYVRTTKYQGHVKANLQLLRLDKQLNWVDGNSIVWDSTTIEHLALLYSGHCKALFNRIYKKTPCVHTAAKAVRTYVRKMRISDYFKPNWETLNEDKLRILCQRTFTEKWWRRRLGVISSRTVEAVLREIGAVKKQSGVYVSNYGVTKAKIRRKRNNAWIEAMSAVSNDGTVIPLKDAVDASVSNPKLRRAELMTRLRGTEEVAKKMDLDCLFLTMTCPSNFHAFLGKSGRLNPKFDGSTPKDGLNYLNNIWKQIRADYGKENINLAGFRVCEPHHDGTPHFHFVIYIAKNDTEKFKEIFKKHNLKIEGDEVGALQHRYDIEELDIQNGSATGYIAKYIAKNIDGLDVGEDLEAGIDAIESSSRVLAWASLWGARQFQSFGSVSTTVYREFRRLTSELTGKDAKDVERARSAADAGDFAAFIEACGGLFVKRADAPFRAFHVAKDKLNSLGEQTTRLLGIIYRNKSVIETRTNEWFLKPTAMLATLEAAQPPPLEYWQ